VKAENARVISNVAHAVSPVITPLEKVTSRGDGSMKSSPTAERIKKT